MTPTHKQCTIFKGEANPQITSKIYINFDFPCKNMGFPLSDPWRILINLHLIRIHIWLVLVGNTWMVDSHGKLESKYSFFLPYMDPIWARSLPKIHWFWGPVHSGRSPPKGVVHFGSELEPHKKIGHSRPFACSRRSVRHLAKTPSDLGRPVMILISVWLKNRRNFKWVKKIVLTKILEVSWG